MAGQHETIVRNPDYDGPDQHGVPPQVRDGMVLGIGFAILMVLLAWGAAVLGRYLFS